MSRDEAVAQAYPAASDKVGGETGAARRGGLAVAGATTAAEEAAQAATEEAERVKMEDPILKAARAAQAADVNPRTVTERAIIEQQKRERPVPAVGVQFDATDMTADEIVTRMKAGVDRWTEGYCLSVLHKRFLTCPEWFMAQTELRELLDGQHRHQGRH